MKLNNNQKQVLIPRLLAEYLEESELSQAQFCKSQGIGEAYVSHIIQGKLNIGKTPIKDKYYIRICEAIGYALKFEIWRHFNTGNFKAIINNIKWARENKERIALDGDTGAGKSYAFAKYKQKYPVNTFLVTCLAIENSKEFCKNIAETVGVETHGTAGSIIKRVVKKLLKLEAPILIIDEAEHIGKKSGYINVVKSLTDLLDGKVPIILSGMGIHKILQDGFDKHKQNFRQTARRFSTRKKCHENIKEDIHEICNELGIKSVSAKNWLSNRIKNFGELKAILVSAIEYAQKVEQSTSKKQPITVALLQTVYDDQ